MSDHSIGLPAWPDLPEGISHWLAKRGGARQLVDLYRTTSVAVGDPPAPTEGQWLVVSGGGNFDGEPLARIGTFRWTGAAWEGLADNPHWRWAEIALVRVDDRVQALDQLAADAAAQALPGA